MKKSISVFLLCPLVLFLLNTTVFAHQMLLEPMPQDKRIKVRYEDGRFSQDTTITLFNAAGEVIFMKKVDENGEFDYSRYPEVASLMADDGMGHRLMWKVGEQVNNVTGNERWIRIGLLAVAISAIGFAFSERLKRKKLEMKLK